MYSLCDLARTHRTYVCLAIVIVPHTYTNTCLFRESFDALAQAFRGFRGQLNLLSGFSGWNW